MDDVDSLFNEFALLFVGLGVIAYAGHSVQTRLEQELSKADEQNKILAAQLEQANARLADIKGQVEVTSQNTQIDLRLPAPTPNAVTPGPVLLRKYLDPEHVRLAILNVEDPAIKDEMRALVDKRADFRGPLMDVVVNRLASPTKA